MKHLFILLLATGIIACQSGDKAPSGTANADSLNQAKKQAILNDTANYTTLSWIDSSFQTLGKVKEGQQVEVTFRFRNTGTKPLVIASVSASCGCTVPEKPEEPVAPGEEGLIKAKFDSNGRPGENRKSIYVDANTTPSRNHEIGFSVFVDKK
jgi:hypothetical protein